MKLSTGKVAFPIEFDNGDKAVIYFNPNDSGIQERIQGFEASVEKRAQEIDFEKYRDKLEKNITADIEDVDSLLEMSVEEMTALQDKVGATHSIEQEYNKIVREELDAVFGDKISDIVFKYCQPFDIVIAEDSKGNETREMYIVHFMRWLALELKKYGEKNKGAMDRHLSKYGK